MKKLMDTFRRSFSARLSLWVVSFATLVFLAADRKSTRLNSSHSG